MVFKRWMLERLECAEPGPQILSGRLLFSSIVFFRQMGSQFNLISLGKVAVLSIGRTCRADCSQEPCNQRLRSDM